MTPNLHAVRTRAHLDCGASRAWDKVCFYEHVELQPTWLLRTALPVPQRTTGAYRKAGDVSSCQYSDGGYLTKRIRHIGGMRVDFDVIEQTIRYAGRIDLKGGTIAITVWLDLSGLPALPAISLGFLVPNVDLLWRQLRTRRAPTGPAEP